MSEKMVYFPGCRIRSRYGDLSSRLKSYMSERYGLSEAGCCKEDYSTLNRNDTVALVCNNCAVELRRLNVENEVVFVTELIDSDEEFSFPDYKGEEMYFQCCSHGYEDHNIRKTVPSLCEKMNITPVILQDEPADGMSYGEHTEIINHNAEKLGDKRVITCCPICNLAYLNKGISSRLINELLFE